MTWLLALYGFAVFGYLTASVASVFVGNDREQQQGEGGKNGGDAGSRVLEELQALRREVAALQADLGRLTDHPPQS
ncbi:hypothetical protein LAJ19_17555 (plasmid) [Deinococcus taeanensis]|uniref:hypothetical protein n=1 Tax=Deinococcus taeanensis TaxID=2737050 RepID=UPI001CDCE5A7|nr:hypothetical protein [Deinococcus taeanensis]UBV44579.1 hypothetical protein LAJ19_17555 [Deinococcus taeanensis]